MEKPLCEEREVILEKLKLRDLLKRYLETETPKKQSRRSETYRIRGILKRPIANLALSQLTTSVFASYRDKRLGEVGHQGVIHELNTMSVVLRTSKIDWDIPILSMPLDDVRRPKMPMPRKRRLEEGEYEKLRETALKGLSPYVWAVIDFAIETGMRQGEIRSLTWEAIHFDRQIAHLEITKNGYSRDVPLTHAAINILHIQKGKNLSNPFPYSVGALRYAWEKTIERAGIFDLRLHDLRHEAISRFFERGLSVPEVALISGHKDFRMLARYTHLRAEDVVEKLK